MAGRRQLCPDKKASQAELQTAHLAAKARTTQATITQTTCRGTGTIEQEAQDRSTDHENMLRHATTATYSDVSHLAATRPKTAMGLLQSYASVWPNIEAPHTRFASLMK